MRSPLLRRPAGFTLPEVMLSVGSSLLLMASVLTGGVALQRSFMAVQGYSMAKGDQLRVQDYIALDCRRSLSVAVANGVLTLTVPKYYTTPTGNATPAPVTPTYDSSTGMVQYNSGETVVITYYRSGTSFIREVDGVARAIATNIDNFVVNPQDLTSSVTCAITFTPRFLYLPGPGPINGTTVFSNTFLRNARARQ